MCLWLGWVLRAHQLLPSPVLGAYTELRLTTRTPAPRALSTPLAAPRVLPAPRPAPAQGVQGEILCQDQARAAGDAAPTRQNARGAPERRLSEGRACRKPVEPDFGPFRMLPPGSPVERAALVAAVLNATLRRGHALAPSSHPALAGCKTGLERTIVAGTTHGRITYGAGCQQSTCARARGGEGGMFSNPPG